MPGTLFIVATPIGNLEDVTFRALRVLKEVAVIAAEDTRRTHKLLQHYSISTPTTSLHAHNEYRKAPVLLARLRRGESIALVSDAGTPLVSDPGERLVSLAHQEGIRVEPVPGPSAVMAALSASGFPSAEFVFAGFPPAKGRARTAWFKDLAGEKRTLVLYEAPHRIRDTLEELRAVLGERPILVGRELTKAHEQLVVCPLSAAVASVGNPRGEYTLVIAAGPTSPITNSPEAAEKGIPIEFRRMTETGQFSRREAVRELAGRTRLSSREVYRRIEEGKKSGD